MVSGSPTEAQVYREPFFSLRRPSRSVVSRFLSHLLIRLMIVSALPGQWQAVAALFPVSMLWPLVAPQERASAPENAGPETRVRGFEQKNASGVGDQASQAAEAHRGLGLGYDGNAVERTVFTGYLWDKETNLFFAKARFYDPEVGRFISQDSYLGQVDDPPSLHRYFYANDNPTRYLDPTGHDSEAANPDASGGDAQDPGWHAQEPDWLQKDLQASHAKRTAPEPVVVTEQRSEVSGVRGWLSKKWNEYQEGAERAKKSLGSVASGAWHSLFGTRAPNESKDQQITALEGDPNAQRIAARDVGKSFENETAEIAREGAEQTFEAGKTYVETELGAKGIGMAAGALKVGGKALGREVGALKAEERALATEERAARAAEGSGAYRDVGGHHVHAKKGFEGHAMYNPRGAFAVSDDLLREYGVRHADITPIQQRLFRELDASGLPKNLTQHTRVAYRSLVEAGIPRDVAKEWVSRSLSELMERGVAGPTKLPWARNK